MTQPPSLLSSQTYARLTIPFFVLVALSTALQVIALMGVIDVTHAHTHRWFGVVEMTLMLLLVANAVRIRMWIKGQSMRTPSMEWSQSVSTWCVWSLCLCTMGDLINRNFPETFYAYGSVIKYTHLADSVWFFFPGYTAFIVAAYLASRASGRVSAKTMLLSASVMLIIGAVSYVDMHVPNTGVYVTLMTSVYACLISVVAITAFWLIKAYGLQAMKWVALGAVLATLADAIIGHFWIFREGYYPAVRHINWVVYFTSQALIQCLPLVLVRLTDDDSIKA